MTIYEGMPGYVDFIGDIFTKSRYIIKIRLKLFNYQFQNQQKILKEQAIIKSHDSQLYHLKFRSINDPFNSLN